MKKFNNVKADKLAVQAVAERKNGIVDGIAENELFLQLMTDNNWLEENAKRHARIRGIEMEDAISIYGEVFTKELENFDPINNPDQTTFTAFLQVRVTSKIKDYVKGMNSLKSGGVGNGKGVDTYDELDRMVVGTEAEQGSVSKVVKVRKVEHESFDAPLPSESGTSDGYTTYAGSESVEDQIVQKSFVQDAVDLFAEEASEKYVKLIELMYVQGVDKKDLYKHLGLESNTATLRKQLQRANDAFETFVQANREIILGY
jgi:hypothetical protein